jgi:type I restriction enzyme S subunit
MKTEIATKYKETEIGTIPEEWDIKTLGEVLDITSSKRIFMSEYVGFGVPFYRGKEIIEKANGDRNISTQLYISEERFSEIEAKFGAPKEGDILMSSVGTLGISYQVGKNERFYFKDGNLTWFRNYADGIWPVYVQYWLRSPIGQRSILSTAIGSTQPALTIDGLKKIILAVPQEQEQKRITEILSSLDDKIELNRKIGANLEKLLSLLFKQWFADFEFMNNDGNPYKSNGGKMVDSKLGKIPEGWQFVNFNNLIEESVNGDWGKEQEEIGFSNKVFCIRGTDISELKKGEVANMPTRFIKDISYKNKRLKNGDIVVEISGGSPTQSTGRSVLITDELLSRFDSPLICSNFCKVIRLKNTNQAGYFYALLDDIYNREGFFQFENGTSGIKNLNLESFFETTFFVISKLESERFSIFLMMHTKLFKRMESKILVYQQSETLFYLD